METTQWRGLRVRRASGSEVTRERDPEDSFSGEDVSCWSGAADALVATGAQKAEIAVPFEPEDGEELFLVSLTYSTGDSFSHTSGIREEVAAYRTEAKARRAEAMIRAHYEREGGGWRYAPLALEAEDGSLQSVGVSWIGYFESLESVEVERCKVENQPRGRPKAAP